MLEKKVSVIIPMYNSEKTIKYCISSVLKQTIRGIEIIVVNDGSSDNSLNIVKDIAFNDSRIAIITKENAGVSSARNTGIDFATGEYLFFLDADDYLDRETIEKIYSIGIANKADLVCCNMIEQNNTKYIKYQHLNGCVIANNKEEIGKNIYNMYLGSACGKLFKAEIIKNNNNNIRFKEYMSIGEDMEFVHQYLCYVKVVAGYFEVNYYIENTNPKSLSKKYAYNMRTALKSYTQSIKKVFKYYPEYEKMYYNEHMDIELEKCVLFVNNLFLNGSPYCWKEKINELRLYLIEENHIEAFSSYVERPKNLLNKIYFRIFKTKNLFIIALGFYFKEELRKLIWARGKKCL